MSSSDDQQGLQASTPQQIGKSRKIVPSPERKERPCGAQFDFPFSKFLEHCLRGSTRSHILPHQSRTVWLCSRQILCKLSPPVPHITLVVNSTPANIILDISKAFDKVDHVKLLRRLHRYGITGKFHDCFRSYWQGRKQQATVLGATSRELPVTSGVPQGSLLGPILFLLFADYLPSSVKTSRVACYTDETKIFKSVDSITEYCNALQSDLGPIHVGL